MAKDINGILKLGVLWGWGQVRWVKSWELIGGGGGGGGQRQGLEGNFHLVLSPKCCCATECTGGGLRSHSNVYCCLLRVESVEAHKILIPTGPMSPSPDVLGTIFTDASWFC